METKRLKNIAILILLLVNAFLLFLLVYQDLQGKSAQRKGVDEMKRLFASEGLALLAEDVYAKESLAILSPVRKSEMETQIAEFLLGTSAAVQSEGGGIVSYTTDAGAVRFRSGGGFDAVRLVRTVEDAGEFMHGFCEKFGYRDVSGTLTDGTGSLTAIRYAMDVPIYGCTVTMTFENGVLVGAAGAYIDPDNAQEETDTSLSCMSALLRFFDHRREEGIVCSEIRSVACVYQLQSAAGSPRLLPVWVVETDTYDYFVDGVTGEISRK